MLKCQVESSGPYTVNYLYVCNYVTNATNNKYDASIKFINPRYLHENITLNGHSVHLDSIITNTGLVVEDLGS